MEESRSAISLPPIHQPRRKKQSTNSVTEKTASVLSSSSSSSLNISNKTLYEEERFKPLAAERWNVQKKKQEQSQSMKEYYDSYVTKCRNLESATNKKVTEMYNRIYYELKWSNPPVSNPHGKLILNYCKHVIKFGSTVPYPYEVELATWNTKVKGNILEKIVGKIKKMYMKLFQYVQHRDETINQLQNELYAIGERMKIKNDTTLRFMMEHNFNNKDKFFTLWNLAATNKIRELTVLLAAPSKAEEYKEYGINTRDPDFGLTALQYACKAAHAEMVQYLLSLGADPNIRAPDGRNALHFAAAYANREILLMLLALGLDAECRDNYQCTPLDLARQNLNKSTIPTLESWGKLTTMQVHLSKSYVDDDYEDFDEGFGLIFGENQDNLIIPDEYKAIDPTIFQQMSPHLKLTTKRLNGFNPYISNPMKITVETMNSNTFSMNSTWSIPQDMSGSSQWKQSAGIDAPISTYSGVPYSTASTPFPQLNNMEKLLSEIRLCSKHYNMCIKEMFFDEAVKSLKRRWLVGKLLYEEIVSEDNQQKQELTELQIVGTTFSPFKPPMETEGGEDSGLALTQARMTTQDHTGSSLDAIQSICSVLTPCREGEDDIPPVSPKPTGSKDGILMADHDNNIGVSQVIRTQEICQQLDNVDIEEECDADEDDEGPSKSLEKIAYDYLSTACNITYLPPTPRTAAIDAILAPSETEKGMSILNNDINPVGDTNLSYVSSTGSNEDAQTLISRLQEIQLNPRTTRSEFGPLSTVLQHIASKQGSKLNSRAADTRDENRLTESEEIHKITLTKSGVLVANDELDLSEASIIAELNKEDLMSLQHHSYDISNCISGKSQEENEQLIPNINASIVSAAEVKIAKLSNPDYILRVVETFMDKSRVIRLEEYSWRYENKELLDHYTQYSSTASLADNSMSMTSASLSVNRSNVGQIISGNYVIRLGYELAEVFLVLKQWDNAYITMEECLSLNHQVLITTRVGVIFQKCDLLIYFFDHWDQVAECVQSLLEYLIVVKKGSSEDHLQSEGLNSNIKSNNSFEEVESGHWDAIQGNFARVENETVCTQQTMDLNELNIPSVQEDLGYLEQYHGNNFEKSHENLHASTVTFDLPPDESFQSHNEFGIRTASALKDDAKTWVLVECIRGAQEVIDLSYILSRNHLIEPYSVAQALSFISKAKERQHQFIEAWQYAEQSSLIAVRCKDATVDSVGLMIEVR